MSLDYPRELKEFNNYFEQVSRRYDPSTIFGDLLTIFIHYFQPIFLIDENIDIAKRKDAKAIFYDLYNDNTEQLLKDTREQRDRAMKGYSDKEHALFNAMFHEILIVQKKMIDSGKVWYDLFGSFYEYLASNFKRSGLGQFFTPEHVVDMVVRMNDDVKENKGMRISDPACGSGRFLLAYHSHNPGNYVYAEDLDPVCVKMTAINMMLHGCEGEVVCHNSLSEPDTIRFGYRINHNIRITGLPSIFPITNEQSFITESWRQKKVSVEKDKILSKEIKPVIIPKLPEIEPIQTSMF